MSRIKLLIVAVVVGVASGSYLSSTGKREVAKVHASAEKQLTAAQAAMSPTLKQVASEQLAAAKTLGANVEIAQAFDDANKPTAAALEVAVSALSKVEQSDGAKPDLLLLISGGAAARYRVGATNRFDKDDSAFKVVGPVGDARGLTAVLDGEAFQIAAAPLALTGDPAPAPIGQVVLGYALNDGFAMRLAKAAGTDVSIVADKKIIASTLPPADKKALPTSARAGGSLDFGDLAGESYSFFGLAKLPLGVAESAPQHGLTVSLGGDSIAVLSVRVANGYADLAADQRQILEFTAGIILLCLLLLLGSNPTKGLSEVASVADKIAQGDLSLRAPTEKVARDVRRLAVAVNAITANAAARRPPAGAAAGSSPSVALGQPKAPGIEDKPLEPPRQTAPEPSRQTSPPPPPPEPKPDFREPSFSGLFGAPPSTGKATAAGPARRDDDFGDIFDSQPPPPSSPPKPLMQPPPPPPPAPAAGVQPMFQEDPDAFNPDATVVAQVPEALVRATRAAASAGSHQAPSRDAVPMAVPLPPATPANTEETHFQSVYREFVATRERCGEPADGLTYDKFVAKLRKNKDQLVAKYACKSVKFQVYVKDGKAALKATPVRE